MADPDRFVVMVTMGMGKNHARSFPVSCPLFVTETSGGGAIVGARLALYRLSSSESGITSGGLWISVQLDPISQGRRSPTAREEQRGFPRSHAYLVGTSLPLTVEQPLHRPVLPPGLQPHVSDEPPVPRPVRDHKPLALIRYWDWDFMLRVLEGGFRMRRVPRGRSLPDSAGFRTLAERVDGSTGNLMNRAK